MNRIAMMRTPACGQPFDRKNDRHTPTARLVFVTLGGQMDRAATVAPVPSGSLLLRTESL